MQIEWEEIARRGRNHAILLVDGVVEAYERHYLSRFLEKDYDPCSYRQFAGARWAEGKDIEKYVGILGKIEVEEGGLLALSEKWLKLLQKAKNETDEISKIEWKGKSNEELFKGFNKFMEAYYLLCGTVYSYIMLNRFYPDLLIARVAEVVPDIHERNEIINTLLTLDKPSGMRKEKEALLNLALGMKEGKLKQESKEFEKSIEEHARKYAYLGIYVFYGKPYTPETIRTRLEHLLSSNLEREVESMRELKEAPAKTRQIIEKYELTEADILKIKTIKEWGFAANECDELFGYMAHYSLELFNEIAERLGIEYKHIIEMRACEIRDALKNNRVLSKEFVEELDERFKDSAYIYAEGKVQLLIGNELKEYYAKEQKQEEAMHHITEVKGQSASSGKVIGIAKIIQDVHDIHKVEKGDILIAASTMPAFVPAMEKAAAIVTNEGGLLSHAAIVSRELKVPCVVGTKTATRVFRDGDKLEVDATRGVIRKV